jgi:hypothetical protein
MEKIAIALVLVLLVLGFFFRDEFQSPDDSSCKTREPGVRGGASGVDATIARRTEAEMAIFNGRGVAATIET